MKLPIVNCILDHRINMVQPNVDILLNCNILNVRDSIL